VLKRRIQSIKIITIIISLIFWCGAFSADDLFFSEYIEGGAHNKALEIFNPGTKRVALSVYAVQFYFNGGKKAGRTIQLEGSIPPGRVFVLANASANAAILQKANQTVKGSWFNGDDSIALLRDGKIIDLIGQIGFDPGLHWGNAPTSTKDQILRRKTAPNISKLDQHQPFEPAQYWNGYAKDAVEDLGYFGASQISSSAGSISTDRSQCGKDATRISNIQGNSDISPAAGQVRTVEAVVTGDFQEKRALSGFFIQEEAQDVDKDVTTSEGLFIFDNGYGVDVKIGDLVRVTGRIVEFYNLTEMNSISSVVVCQSGLTISPSELKFPVSGLAALESQEGMLVRVSQPLFVTGTHNLGRYGEILLSAGERLFVPTQVELPGRPAIAVQEAMNLNKIILDDASSEKFPDPIIYPSPKLDADHSLRIGDSVKDIIGVLSYGANGYRIQPTKSPQFESRNPRLSQPLLSGKGRLRVASFNVLNYFNGDGESGGFPTKRGASSAGEFKRQRDKIISAINAMNVDIIGLMEIENDGYDNKSAIKDLIDGLNSAGKDRNLFRFIRPGLNKIGSDAITVGMIYRTSSVEAKGSHAILNKSVISQFDDRKNRPSLAQTFIDVSSGAKFTLVVNHFKSKGSPCVGDPDTGDGQGNCNQTRTRAAQALVSWLQSDPTHSGDADFLVIGDLNSYAKEDPVAAIESGGYVNLVNRFEGKNAYSYVFDGLSGTLDHAFASNSLASQVSDVSSWHINADEPSVLDYNEENKSSQQKIELYSANPFRASDHDPMIIELNLK